MVVKSAAWARGSLANHCTTYWTRLDKTRLVQPFKFFEPAGPAELWEQGVQVYPPKLNFWAEIEVKPVSLE